MEKSRGLLLHRAVEVHTWAKPLGKHVHLDTWLLGLISPGGKKDDKNRTKEAANHAAKAEADAKNGHKHVVRQQVVALEVQLHVDKVLGCRNLAAYQIYLRPGSSA